MHKCNEFTSKLITKAISGSYISVHIFAGCQELQSCYNLKEKDIWNEMNKQLCA